MIIEDKYNRRVGHITLFGDALNSVVELGEGIDF